MRGRTVGAAELSQTASGVLLKLSLKGLPAGDRAFHIQSDPSGNAGGRIACGVISEGDSTVGGSQR